MNLCKIVLDLAYLILLRVGGRLGLFSACGDALPRFANSFYPFFSALP